MESKIGGVPVDKCFSGVTGEKVQVKVTLEQSTKA
jgi:hypothetical protein